MDALLNLFHSITTIIFFSFKDITKEDIEKNIEKLRSENWFQEYMEDEKYNKLIMENENVRKIIGSMNMKKMIKRNYNRRQQKRIKRELNSEFEKYNYI